MEWWQYVIIAAAVIIVAFVVVSLFGDKNKNRQAQPKETVTPTTKEHPVLSEEKVVQSTKKVEPTPVQAEEKITKEEPDEEVTEKELDEKITEKEEENDKVAKYHVSQNKDEKSARYKEWRVRKEGSNKTIKYFQTQKEAIDYAEELAESAGSSIVIHKLDGSIRKQDYTKKES